MTLFLALITVHFIADFVLQTNWMAIEKSKRWDALLLHVTVYTLCFVWMGWWFTLITFVLHFAVDFFTSRLGRRWFFFEPLEGTWVRNVWVPRPKYRYPFFVLLGFDQLLHVYSLVLAARWAGAI